MALSGTITTDGATGHALVNGPLYIHLSGTFASGQIVLNFKGRDGNTKTVTDATFWPASAAGDFFHAFVGDSTEVWLTASATTGSTSIYWEFRGELIDAPA